MAKLEAYETPGFLLEMYPEDHSPPHFHVIKNDWNIRIKFNLSYIKGEIIWDSKYPESLSESPLNKKESKSLLALIENNRPALNEQWRKLHPSKQRKNESSAKETSRNRSGKILSKGTEES